ncbi:MAG: putative glycoside hydrolase [Candidatus Margulisiibacteriota bacterium]
MNFEFFKRIIFPGLVLALLLVLALSPMVFSSILAFSWRQPQFPRHPNIRLVERGIYLTQNSATNQKFLEAILKKAKASGLNSVVIDVKGLLQGNFSPALRQKKLFDCKISAPSPALKKIVDVCHAQGFIVSGRIVAFLDWNLVNQRPDLAIRDQRGVVWRDRSGNGWADPFSREVWEYNYLIAELAAWSGVDEVQYDYVRFPTDGRVKNAVYTHQNKEGGRTGESQAGLSRTQNIAAFLASARQRLRKYNVALTADIFGVTAWQGRRDVENLGQDIRLLAGSVDAICPMLYPSHFARGYDGFAFPGNEPYYFVQKGIAQIQSILVSSESIGKSVNRQQTCKVIPWIQGFGWGTTIFGPDYISKQIRAAQDEKVTRFLIWNAANNYANAFRALSAEKIKP